jgi:hypothetical protein
MENITKHVKWTFKTQWKKDTMLMVAVQSHCFIVYFYRFSSSTSKGYSRTGLSLPLDLY